MSSYDHLLTALHLLASPAVVQRQYYGPHQVVVADEMALDYHDAFLGVDSLRQTHCVTAAPYATLVNLNQMLDAMSAFPELWSLEALTNSPHWQELRSQATAALALLRGEPPH